MLCPIGRAENPDKVGEIEKFNYESILYRHVFFYLLNAARGWAEPIPILEQLTEETANYNFRNNFEQIFPSLLYFYVFKQ